MKIQTPASHTGDPETSRIAEANMNKGKRFTHQSILREYVAKHKGETAGEIGQLTGLGQHECSRRLSELCGIHVEKGERRKCQINGTSMVTWWPIGND